MQNDPRNEADWHRDLVERLASDALIERRRTRRWGIFFKLLTFAYLIGVLALLLPKDWSKQAIGGEPHTALVELEGLIAPGAKASADNVVTGLRDAFEDENTKAVVLRINSPGGSPVQSSDIHKEILRLRAKYPEIPLYAVVSDMCASGGYYVAAAADRIYVNESSIVGSIGVLMNGFGFVDSLDKLGIERRLLTAGENKALFDPFSPVKEHDKTHLQGMLEKIHQQFIETVKRGRGDRLAADPQIFSGLFWTGEESVTLGLADGMGSSSYVAREIIGAEEIVDFTMEEDLLERLAQRMGAGVTSGLSGIFGAASLPALH